MDNKQRDMPGNTGYIVSNRFSLSESSDPGISNRKCGSGSISVGYRKYRCMPHPGRSRNRSRVFSGKQGDRRRNWIWGQLRNIGIGYFPWDMAAFERISRNISVASYNNYTSVMYQTYVQKMQPSFFPIFDRRLSGMDISGRCIDGKRAGKGKYDSRDVISDAIDSFDADEQYSGSILFSR